MNNSVPNVSNTCGFVDLDELETEEVTKLSTDLLRDALQALEVLEGGSWNEGHLHLVESSDEDWENPAIALSTDLSNDVAVMVASRSDGDRDE